MTSSTSSSGEPLAILLLGLALLAPAPPARAEPEGSPRGARVVVLPVANLSGAPAPLAAIQAALELALARAGVDVVGGELASAFLARHRIRWTGGVTGAEALAARADLGADGILLASVGLHTVTPTPKVALFARLVAADDPPRIVWAGEAGRAGDDAPGLLGLGLVGDSAALDGAAIEALARSLAARLRGEPTPPPCPPPGRRHRPRSTYGKGATVPAGARIAVLPFANETGRRDAGELVALEFVHQLAEAGLLRPLEPGEVRSQLLSLRMVLESGVSVDAARAFLGTADAELVMTGTVHEYDDPTGSAVPRVAFTAMVLERASGQITWKGSTRGKGDDGVWFFDAGRVSTARDLACRLVTSAVAALQERALRSDPAGGASHAPSAPRGGGNHK